MIERAAVYRALFVASLVAALAPILVSRYLPFCDMYGAMGVMAAYLHRGDAVRAVDPYFTFHATLTPTAFYWAFLWVVGQVVAVPVANKLFIVLFFVVLPPLALAYALHSFGRSPWLALLAFVVTYNGTAWFGFMGATASFGLTVLVIALANDVAQARRPRLTVPALAAASGMLAAVHCFQALIGIGLALLTIGLAPAVSRRWRGIALAALLPGFAYLAQWLRAYFPAGRAHQPGRFRALLDTLADLWAQRGGGGSFDEMRTWFVEGLKQSRIDDALAVVAVATIVALLIFGIRGAPATPQSRGARVLPWLLAVTPLFLYWLLPMKLMRPIYWWAVRPRMLPLAFLLAPLAVRTRPRGLPVWVLGPVVALSITWSLTLARDFRGYFNGVHMAGFDELLDAIPPGQRVILLITHDDLSAHYEHGSYAYVMTHYIARSGGIAYPLMHGAAREVWSVYHPFEAPAWGIASRFHWKADAKNWDYIVVKDAERGPTTALTDAPPGAAPLVGQFGKWRLYHKLHD